MSTSQSTEAATEPRPKFSAEIALIAATEVISGMIANGLLDGDQRDDSIAGLVKHARQHMDGYEIAKALDLYAHWDCNLEMAEALDDFSSEVRDAIDAAEKEWAARTNVQPPLPIGSRVQLRRGETGKITGIYEHGAAKYLVKIDGDPQADTSAQSRRIINFEDATALTISGAA